MAAAVPAGESHEPDEDPRDDLEGTLARIEFSPPTLSFVGRTSGRAMPAGQTPEAAYWLGRAPASTPIRQWAPALAKLDVDLVVEIGARRAPMPVGLADWAAAQEVPGHTFVHSVARAYEAGLPVEFAGLFAGESRRRISLPGYPFQSKRHWI